MVCLDGVPDCLSARVPSALRVRRAAVLREHGQVQAQTGTSTRTYRTALTHLTASTASAASTAARARGARISPRFRQGKAANHKPTQQVRGGSVPSEAFTGRHWPAIGPPLARAGLVPPFWQRFAESRGDSACLRMDAIYTQTA